MALRRGRAAQQCRFLMIVAILICTTAGCSPVYVMRAAYEQSKILLARRPIDEVINDPATTKEDAEKLALVLEARRFAAEIGLSPGNSFTQYADIGKDTLAWVVMASRRDSFALYTWWFPIVGTVPYKGFFDQHDARDQAQQLESQGYESSVRGTEAFSTLGWFNDPLLSTTLKNSATRIVNTVLHESVHSTVWIPDHVPFNESLANFVGSRATVDFFALASGGDSQRPTGAAAGAAASDVRAQSEREHQFSMEFADCVGEVFDALEALYRRTDLTSEEKVHERERVFEQVIAPFRLRYPAMSAFKKLNNAELLQSTIYTTKLRLFARLYQAVGRDWPEFFKRIAELRERLTQERAKGPFEELDALVASLEASFVKNTDWSSIIARDRALAEQIRLAEIPLKF